MLELFESLSHKNLWGKLRSVLLELQNSPHNRKSSPNTAPKKEPKKPKISSKPKKLHNPPAEKNKPSYLFAYFQILNNLSEISKLSKYYIYKHVIDSPLLLDDNLAKYRILDIKYFFPRH